MGALTRRQQILLAVEDLVVSFIAYDRAEDEDLPRGDIEDALAAGEITVDDIVSHFRSEFSEALE